MWAHYGAVLYPPPFLLLIVPFTVLPAVLWYVVPLAIVAGAIAWHRPRPSAWPFLAMGLAWPSTMQAIAHGNPVLWAWAAVAAGTLWGWPAVAVLLKPSLFPFALIGVHRRSWWIALAGAAAISALFAPMWADWARAMIDSRGTGILYSAKEIPMMLLPLVAWLGGDAKNPAPRPEARGGEERRRGWRRGVLLAHKPEPDKTGHIEATRSTCALGA